MSTTAELTNEPDESGDGRADVVARKKHSLAVRWMHWINFPLLMIMMWSGMRIYWADRAAPYALGIGSWQIFEFWPSGVNSALHLEARLAKGIAFHLNFGWFFVLNGAVYVLYLSRRGRWHQIVPDLESVRDARTTVTHDLHITSERPAQGKYNPAQQVAYTLVMVIAFLLVTSGFAIYKPVQLSWLVTALGGYDSARFVHFTSTILLLVFFFVHVFEVARAGWSTFASMVTGYRLGRRDDPEIFAPSTAVPIDPVDGSLDVRVEDSLVEQVAP